MLSIGELGGQVAAYGKDGKSQVCLGITEHGGVVSVTDKYGQFKLLD